MIPAPPRAMWHLSRALLCVTLAPLLLAGCLSSPTDPPGGLRALPEWNPMRYAPSSPGAPWQPRPDKVRPLPGARLAAIPPALEGHASSLTPSQLIDVAPGTPPRTRDAWERA